MCHFGKGCFGAVLIALGLFVMENRANTHDGAGEAGCCTATTSSVRLCRFASQGNAASTGVSCGRRARSTRASYASAKRGQPGASVRRTASLSQRNRSGGIR